MIIESTPISGLRIIHLNKFLDQRGSFVKIFNEETFNQEGLETNFKESYYSVSAKNVVRGMHFQAPPFDHTKLVYLTSGRILDVVLDLRSHSKTFGQYFTVEITTANPIAIYIPIGCAHGFLSLEHNSIVTYMQSSCYNSNADFGVHYDSFGFKWPVSDAITSDRDAEFPTLKQFKTPF